MWCQHVCVVPQPGSTDWEVSLYVALEACFAVFWPPALALAKFESRAISAARYSSRVTITVLGWNTGYEHAVESVVDDLLACLDDPRLPLLQWNELYAVAQSRLPADLATQLEHIVGEAPPFPFTPSGVLQTLAAVLVTRRMHLCRRLACRRMLACKLPSEDCGVEGNITVAQTCHACRLANLLQPCKVCN